MRRLGRNIFVHLTPLQVLVNACLVTSPGHRRFGPPFRAPPPLLLFHSRRRGPRVARSGRPPAIKPSRDWNWKEAEAHFLRALSINPSFAQAHHDHAFYLVATGHPESRQLRRCAAPSLSIPFRLASTPMRGGCCLQAHHFEEAIAQANLALELEPGLAGATACIARAERDTQVYRSILDRGERTSFFNRAMAYAGVGREEEALRALQSSYEQREVIMPLVRTEPAFTGLHGDPRFREIVGKMGLP